MRSPLLSLCLVAACSSSTTNPAADLGPRPELARADSGAPDRAPGDAPRASEARADQPAPDLGPKTHECALGEQHCSGWNLRRYCSDTPAGRRWTDETCAAGSGCVKGDCASLACSDECDLGDSQAGKDCALYDLKTQSWAAPAPAASRHDRARAFAEWLHRDGMAHGGVGSTAYSDPPSYKKPATMHGIGDSAIWTGTYLAAEALRLKATGAAAARARVKSLVATLHLWFNVSGAPGMLARFAAPAGAPQPVVLNDLKCGSAWRVHCNVSYQGAAYDYIGHISRDQYQGVLLGYALAYEALGPADEPTRALIREDALELVEELMKERTVQVKLSYNGTALPQFPVQMRFAVLAPAEMDGGAVALNLDTSKPDDSTMKGFQEFIPNLQDVLKQVPVIGGLVPPIPRASSAIMLASFFRVALAVSDGVPAAAARRAAIEAFYLGNKGLGGNVSDWLAVAAQWDGGTKCGDAYYGNNITMEPMYNLARLETDPARRKIIVGDVLTNKMWQTFKTTKNTFFAFIYAANAASPLGSEIAAATAQLDGFKPPPRVHVAVDLRADPKYLPHESGCTDQVTHATAVDVADRPVEDFLWQRHPWKLYDAGDLGQSEPGVDYLVAYWMGRHHGFIAEDAPARCLRWK
jgi:hypothetical protein